MKGVLEQRFPAEGLNVSRVFPPPQHVSRAGCLSLSPGIPAPWHQAQAGMMQHSTAHWQSSEHDAKATKWDSPQKVIVVNSFSSRLTPLRVQRFLWYLKDQK